MKTPGLGALLYLVTLFATLGTLLGLAIGNVLWR